MFYIEADESRSEVKDSIIKCDRSSAHMQIARQRRISMISANSVAFSDG